MRTELPTGTVTFLFTDIEASTRLLDEIGADAYAEALAAHRQVVRDACAEQGGVEVDTQGDAFFFAFPTAPGALAAAAEMTEALAPGRISVRVGMHTGTPVLTAEGYVGGDVHRAARIAASGHGGQVLVSASAAQLVALELRDLGEHRFKDLAAPERVYQLGDGDFPTLRSLYRTNLPVLATPFVGRERELAEVVELVERDGLRLLTLTGPGGTGKTRLALQAAAEASESFPDGVYWVPLAPLRDPALVLATAAQILGSENGLAEHIADRSMLCLFDNFEQVVEAGPELAALLGACPNLGIRVTSRERLRVSGEQAYPVPPLAEGDGEALFVSRARAIDPSFVGSDAVRELCLRLDELPLAIELAAARTALFSPEQLLERLSQRLDLLSGERDADPRQQTLRATIEWSHDLLSEGERRLFSRLAVFAGSCGYEAAEEIAGADPDTLQWLLDKSLLRKRDSPVGARYWMLETIREFAVERLEASGEAEELRRRHAEYFLNLAEEAHAHLIGSEEKWHDRLDVENDNLRAALDWLEATAETQLALQLAGALGRFWILQARAAEGRERLERLLALDERPTAARARALNGAALMSGNMGDSATARMRSEEALELHRELGDEWGIARSVAGLGSAAADESDWVRARLHYEDSLDRFRALGDSQMELIAASNLGWVLDHLGDPEARRRILEENLARWQALGHKSLESNSLAQLAILERDSGRLAEAVAMLKEAIRILTPSDVGLHRLEAATDLGRMASVLALAGDLVPAAQLLASSEVLTEELGAVTPSWAASRNERTRAIIRSQLDEQAFTEASEQGAKLSFDEAVALALGEAWDGSVTRGLPIADD